MCDYRYRDCFCANGKVSGMRCVGDGECPLRDRSSSTFKEKRDWYRHHDLAYPGVWRK